METENLSTLFLKRKLNELNDQLFQMDNTYKNANDLVLQIMTELSKRGITCNPRYTFTQNKKPFSLKDLKNGK